MINASRRSLADYTVKQLIAGDSPSKLAKSMVASLVSSGKKKDPELLIADVYEKLEALGLLAIATVTSAKPLSVKSRNSIKNIIAKNARVKEVIINEVVDETVIGGFRAQTSAHSWDETIAHKLALIKGGM